MATMNSFGLLWDDDTEDLSLLISAQKQKAETKKAEPPSAKPAVELAAAKLPSKPLPPAQAVREEKTESARGNSGGGRVYGRGRGRGRGRVAGRGSNNDSINGDGYGNKEMHGAIGATEGADTGQFFEKRGGYGGSRGPFRGGRRGGFSNGEVEEGEQEHPRRHFDRHSGTGYRNEIKREGTGRGNWGTPADQPSQVAEEVVNEGENNPENLPKEDDPTGDGDKEISTIDIEKKDQEDKEMTLEEYEKVLEKKRIGLQPFKTKERKVDTEEFKAMQQLANKKTNDDIFIKLGSDKDKRKELTEKEDKSKKSVSINEFLKPPEGEKYHSASSRNRGRGRGSRGGYGRGSDTSSTVAPSIEDRTQFPTLGGK